MFTLPDLPYAYDALEPHIDARTMELHHSKHHQTYVDKLNAAVKDTDFADKPLEDLLQDLNSLPEKIRTAVRNNGGGHYNHSFFWHIMEPNAGGVPEVKLSDLIKSSFGDFSSFKEKFSEAAIGRFGSGWAWLIREGDSLNIVSTPNQDIPLMDGVKEADILLGLDVWEHAYYLKYQNRRPEYIDAWWNVVNWQNVAKHLES